MAEIVLSFLLNEVTASIPKNPGKASKIKGFLLEKGAYYTIFERALM